MSLSLGTVTARLPYRSETRLTGDGGAISLGAMLTDGQLVAFRRDGFIAVRQAVPLAVVDRCVDVIWQRLAERGVRRNEPATWTEPLIRIDCPEDDHDGGPFAEAGTTPALWQAYDQLLRPGTWWKRKGIGGTVPVGCSCSPTSAQTMHPPRSGSVPTPTPFPSSPTPETTASTST